MNENFNEDKMFETEIDDKEIVKKNSTSIKAIIIISTLVILSLIVIGVIIFLYFTIKKDEDIKETEEEVVDFNYSFKAVYTSKENNETVQLIDTRYFGYINYMVIDSKNITPCSNYSFEFPGNHTVYVLIYHFIK